MSVFNLFA